VGLGLVGALVLPNQLEWKSSSPYRDSLRGVLNYREGSGRGRLIQYRNSLNLVRANPVLGVGPGNWVVAYPEVTTPGDPSFNGADPMPTNPWPSSDWVAVITERGPFGAVLVFLALAAIAVIAIRRMRDPDPARGAAALAALALLVATVVQGLFDAVMLLAPPSIIAMAGLGALLPSTRPIPIGAERRPGRRRMALAAIVLLGAFAVKSGAQLQAIRQAGPGSPTSRLVSAVRFDPSSFRLHYLLAQRSRCPEAEIHARRLVALFPAHSWPKRLLGRCARGYPGS
jgi:hypothetical protein